MKAKRPEIDPITLSVVHNGLLMVSSEMDLVQEKMSFSPVISEAMDRANGIYHRDDGSLIVQGQRGLPLFIGIMQATTGWVLKHQPDLADGDVVIINDPYLGGTHLMDVRLVKPFYYRGELWCYLSSCAHWADVGGGVPGGFASDTREVQAEGLRIPPVRICQGGRLNQDMLDLILANCRVPEERVGDFKAQLGALNVGARRLTALLDRYGADTVEAVIEELKARSEREMRSHIDTIPDGTYRGQAFIDSDGITEEALKIDLALTVRGSEMTVDLSGSSPPCRGPLNCPWSTTESAIYIAIKHTFPEVPVSSGGFVPITILPAEETFLHARYPRPVAGAAAEVSQRVVEAMLEALSKAVPERAYAGMHGTAGNFSLGGYDPHHDRPYIMYYFSGGGYGGSWAGDGHSNACAAISFAATQPFEIMEQHYPILVEHARLSDGSGGAGKNRGGLGVDYRVRLLRGEASASFMMDHGRIAPYALFDGKEGATTEIIVCRNGEETRPRHVSKGSHYRLKAGDWVEVHTPGGGGFGDPRQRDRDLVRRDLSRGYITPSQARNDYGLEPADTPPSRAQDAEVALAGED